MSKSSLVLSPARVTVASHWCHLCGAPWCTQIPWPFSQKTQKKRMSLVRLSIMTWSFSITAHTMRDLSFFQICQNVFLSLHPILIRENDVKLFYTGKHLNLWGYFMTPLWYPQTDLLTFRVGWLIYFPISRPLYVRFAIWLRYEAECHWGVGEWAYTTSWHPRGTPALMLSVYWILNLRIPESPNMQVDCIVSQSERVWKFGRVRQ